MAIALQLALLLILVRVLEIEPGTGLPRILPLVFAGFIVHAMLPHGWRLKFFLVLSVTAFCLVLGPLAGVTLFVLGLVLIGICHLPIAFPKRVILLALAVCILAALRAGLIDLAPALASIHAPTLPQFVLPVLASMFMFRLVIYLYDLRHEERAAATGKQSAAASPMAQGMWARLSYFFLLPNVCFLLFPIVDYRTYRRTYYDRDAYGIYQTGISWICLGLIYLLLYRVVYHYVVPMPEEVQGLGGVVRFMVGSYLVYLRVVGQFHLITGILCLFGFNLPPAHHFYLLASGFTDFWRRARVDWKDFMVKIFYYPTLVPLQRRWGPRLALIVATVVVFVATWLLHAYQWFWLRGDFRLSMSDTVFWTIIGGCVLANSLLEARRVRSPRASGFAPRAAVAHALRVIGMFLFMSVLWSYWSSPSFRIWVSYLTAANESGVIEYLRLGVALAGLLTVGVLAQLVAARIAGDASTAHSRKPAAGSKEWRPIAVLATATLLLLVRAPQTSAAFGEPILDVVATLSTNTLNAVDQEREDRGYYETLLDEPRSAVTLVAVSGSGIRAGADSPSRDEDNTASIEPIRGAGVAGSLPNDSSPAPPAIAQRIQPHESEPTASGVTQTPRIGSDSGVLQGISRTPAPLKKSAREGGAKPTSRLAIDSGIVPSAGSTNADGTLRRRVVGRRLTPYERMTNDLTMWENLPNFAGSFKGAPVSTNQWGMRDREYSLARPPGTYRIALLGTSMTTGIGVPIEQTMETLLEDRLNRDGLGGPDRKFEILNFSVGGYGIMQNTALADRRVFSFAPSAVMVGVFSVDVGRMAGYLSKVVRAEMPIPYPYVRAKLLEAGVNSAMGEPELRRRLGPISEDMVQWSYERIVEACRQRGVRVFGVVLPEPFLKAGHDIDQAARLAAAAGLPLLDLRGVYEGHNTDSLHLIGENNDPHWNALGHKLISDRLYELLRRNDRRILEQR